MGILGNRPVASYIFRWQQCLYPTYLYEKYLALGFSQGLSEGVFKSTISTKRTRQID
ncbi:maturase [Roseibium sp. TrichSKD4]|nr:maturase [Roseibium sp. TrichSKD4]